MSKQKTLKTEFTLSGKGLHTGATTTLTAKPAADDFGIVFCRIDLEGQPTIPALAEYVSSTARGTVLKNGKATIGTVEHLLSALYAAGIDNCLIEVDAPEIPIIDGSAKYFVEKIREAQIVEQENEKNYFTVTEKMVFRSEDKRSSITILPDTEFSVQALIGYNSPVLNNQYAVLDSMSDYAEQISPCRTFVFVRELEPLLKANLIKGGDLENAIVINDAKISQEEMKRLADLMKQPCPTENLLGYLNTDLLFDNEPARHKLLDLIGDFALIGRPLKGRIIANHPGHKVNTAFALQLRREIKKRDVFVPAINLNAPPVMDINRIKQLLPHRYPFLLVDKVMEIGETHIVAIKNVTFNEMQFLGHFPQEPVMPGVLQVEAMAQAIGLYVLNQMENPQEYSTYFMKIDNVKFRQKVIPGDIMIMRVGLMTPIKRGIATVKGYVFVNGNIATEAEMMAQIVKKK
ncbi:MAG: bifunctional UDP-3-O-[3-hydroxymyristoyl] N-acetylglucosamine deacetylase/3-hydroxyacyl-ACP dehydratase [Prevotellaceae bacterium]|jgi:UDP-3-O-[3-hydroxymyristoyl] N-acetylglucosamine deacetylase/3-hydroxyacyl-[acyl-carrier-protein] dehydratase|nr:bifunctional UDP-3-O-[3-hydroxymyristoyl] N-acetylglucosamine deacetylase/3-hydroxyacyl-ACP dehydratase [Prevotellaceae bacterium]